MFPVMFALSRATVLFISYLSWEAAPFLVLWLKSRLLLGLFFSSLHLLACLGYSSTQSTIYKAEGKLRELL